MNKLGILILCLMCLASVSVAHMIQPYDGNNRSYTDIDFYGVNWKIITDTTTWTTVFSRKGIIYGIYCIGSSTYTTNVNYFRAATDTNTVVVSDLDVVGNSTRTGSITDAISFLPVNPIYSAVGLKVKPGPQTDSKAIGTAETTIYILYRSR